MDDQQLKQKILDKLDESGHKKVQVAITDVDGVLRGKYMHIDKFRSAVEKGFGFCSVVFGWDNSDAVYNQSSYTGWHNGFPDSTAKIDLQTFRLVPWNDHIPFFLGDFHEQDHSPSPVCPRQVLKKVIAYGESLGYKNISGCEFEWFNFKENPHTLHDKNYAAPTPLTPGMFGYSLLRSHYEQDYFNAIINECEQFKIPIEGLHTESGPGVYEVAITCSDPLETADRASLFKTSVKQIANRHNITASFMARWDTNLPGCSGHIHQSLLDKNGNNVFFDPTAPDNISKTFEHYLAGLIKYTPELLVMMAPTINSYKRLVEGYWAPTTSSWGIDNRTCAFRVIPYEKSSCRVEVRVPGSDVNPYLGLSAALLAGLRGIEEKLPLNSPKIEGNGYEVKTAPRLPASLKEATQRFVESSLARNILGDKWVDHFCESRQWEQQQFDQAVTDWEMKRYFEIV